jgi:hypothetical protein
MKRTGAVLGYGLLAMFLGITPGVRAQESARPPVLVFFADGTSLPLRTWSLSYEYATWKKGESPARGATSRRTSTDLYVGGRTVATAGAVMEVQYQEGIARGLLLTAPSGKKSPVKPEAPSADLLAPGLEKDLLFQARGLDLRGETLTGGKRDYCLLSYTVLIECAGAPEERVVKIQFPP